MKKEKGQAVLILILVMTVGLAIGLSVIQRSLSDISTSSKVEQSSRAFSAAEAGIEKTLALGYAPSPFPLQNSQVSATDTGLSPAVIAGTQGPLEIDPLAKEEITQIWLAEYTNLINNPPPDYYKQSKLDAYWGDPTATTDPAAIELTLIFYGTDARDQVDPLTVKYRSRKWYLDSVTRNPPNNFGLITDCGTLKPSGFTNSYRCHVTLGDPVNYPVLDSSGTNTNYPLPTTGLMLIRARLLYNNTSQPFAVRATGGSCGRDCSVPPQKRVLVSTGTSGQTQRTVKLQQTYEVVPQYFDYAIFSAGTISK